MSSAIKKKATRSSLACLPCRVRHIKCDGNKPSCNGCNEAGKQCDYTRSRRGGLDRKALAERRKRLATVNSINAQTPASIQTCHTNVNEDIFNNSSSLLDAADGTFIAPPLTHIGSIVNIEDDVLVDSYYNNFHKFHPFLLPNKHLLRLYRDSNRQSSLTPLIAAMRFVGHIYSFQQWDMELKNHLEACFCEASPTDPVMVQSRLIYSIALFWYDYKTEAASQIEAATQLAIDMGMFRREFASEHGAGDPILEECWRRTWWMLYVVEAFYAGTLGTKTFKAMNMEATVDLPCQELEYESGKIPIPKTLQEFDCREFATDETTQFSSFAYLIGAVRCAVLAMSTTPKLPAKEDSLHIMQTTDSALDGWLLLLPKDKQIMNKSGEIDELMFQAHLLIHVATVGLHRPLSDLKFNSVENISSCSRDPPINTPTPELVNIHTVRVLRSVEAQVRLLTLPVRKFAHTPFTTCMVSEGTLALLSACNFIFRGKELATAREQIRMIIGCLKVLGEVWPRITRNVREIQTIAQHVLGLGSEVAVSNGPSSTPDIDEVPFLSSGSEGLYETGGFDVVPLESIEDLCGFYNLPSLDFDG
ncbi:hypothetical protein TMatcc_010518 [Talaromyces marneffei ATCC 18224]|uniref:C6 transcription factor, putative n=1 Tax=Talaromyces marneffei (strain ATCC 18224 / CBS 334.59 / QM 7333) TaxID=441960 RepID=B6QVC7_TALMQ|nr:C6 transcription factor, putative [Talaromyces marneffei ATCC 18224]